MEQTRASRLASGALTLLLALTGALWQEHAAVPSPRAMPAAVQQVQLAATVLPAVHHRHRQTPGHRAWDYARGKNHDAYVWGATGPRSFDCSGLVVAAYRSIGIHLPRTTEEMLASKRFRRIPASWARRGDLVFYGSGHVEFWTGHHESFGALNPSAGVGWHHWVSDSGWHPTAWLRVRGSNR